MSQKLNHHDYTVGWICALPIEYAAAKAMLDDSHSKLSQPPSDSNTYTLGKIFGHNVVIACLPSGIYGTVSAANVATQMLSTFRSIEFGLMVGIGGGVPSDKADVRLGDVVVSKPTGDLDGVVQYDFGKSVGGGRFQRTGFLNKPPQVLLTAIADLESEHMMRASRIGEFLADMASRFPSMASWTSCDQPDWLFKADYDHHIDADDCGMCDADMIVPRGMRLESPAVHYGLIASGTRVMKDGITRDQLAKDLTDVLCFEMEASGLMDNFPCLVIRGISDYSDSHKNKKWQKYAAATAAAYAKELISVIPVLNQPGDQRSDSNLPTDDDQQDLLLKQLGFVEGARFDSYLNDHITRCLPDTRVDMLDQLLRWSEAADSRPIFWLRGMVGTGKTTIAITIAEQLAHRNELGASFFFSRGGGDRSHAGKLFTTLAVQLARHLPGLKGHICSAITEHPDIATRSFREQWKRLIFEPLSRLHQAVIVTVVIDALDECDSDESIEKILALIVDVKALSTVRLRILLTSRPEVSIRYGFKEMPETTRKEFDLLNIGDFVIQNDISIFFRTRLGIIRKRHDLAETGPGTEVIQTLSRQASSLFIYAATVCRFIEHSHFPTRSLDDILQNRQHRFVAASRALDQMYTLILNRTFLKESYAEEIQEVSLLFRQVISCVVLTQSPLSQHSISSLLSLDLHVVKSIVNSLHSVLQVPNDIQKPILLLHPSFRDFLLNPAICLVNYFHISEIELNWFLALNCIDRMSESLSRNVCSLRLPGIVMKTFASERVSMSIPEHWRYACRYWIYHLQRSLGTVEDFERVLTFLKRHFLHWLECLRWLHDITSALIMLDVLQTSHAVNISSELHLLLHDARRFILSNRSLIEKAPLQLYISALIYCPTGSIIRTLFAHEIPIWIVRLPRVEEKWSPCLQVIESGYTAPGEVISPFDDFIASKTGKFVKTWDLNTGANIHTLDGHDDVVIKIEISHDGNTLASASWDKTLILWDTRAGSKLHTLIGHSNGVDRVTFSHDDKLLASAAKDLTVNGILKAGTVFIFYNIQFLYGFERSSTAVQLWDPITGSTLHNLEAECSAVSISPNCKNMAIEIDGGVQLYDPCTMTAKNVLQSSNWTTNLIFSPDDSLLAIIVDTGVQTLTLRDAASGTKVHTLFSGISICATAFSADSSYIACASSNTIRVWNTQDGKLLSTIQGAPKWAESMTFSRSGKLIVLGCSDGTVRLYDLIACFSSTSPSNGSDMFLKRPSATSQYLGNDITGLAFSPNGQLVGTGSKGMALRLWDPIAGTHLSDLKPNTLTLLNGLSCIAFSPNSEFLVYQRSHRIRVWNMLTREAHDITHYSTITALAFASDSNAIAVGYFDDDTNTRVGLLNPRTGFQFQTLHRGCPAIYGLAFSPDSSIMVGACPDGKVGLWNLDEYTLARHLEGPIGAISMISFSHDGSMLAIASSETTTGIWDPTDGTQLHKLLAHSDAVCTVVFSADDRLLASGSLDSTIQLWNPRIGAHVGTLAGHCDSITAIEISPNGDILVSASLDSTIRVWDPVQCAQLHRLETDSNVVFALKYSLSRNSLVSMNMASAVHIWDPTRGLCLFEQQGKAVLRDFTFSSDGSFLISQYALGTFTMMNLVDKTSKVLPQTHAESLPTCMTLSPDDKNLAIGSLQGIELCDPMSGDRTTTIRTSGIPQEAQFAPNGEILAVANNYGDTELFHPLTGAKICTFASGFPSTWAMAFSPDRRMLACGTGHNCIELWNLTKTQAIGVLDGNTDEVCALAFDSESRLLASGSRDGFLRVWDLSSMEMVGTWKRLGQVLHVEFVNNDRSIQTNQGMVDVSHLAQPPLQSAQSTFWSYCEATHWITWKGHNLIWVPGDHRTEHWAMRGNIFAMGHPLGHVSFLEFSGSVDPISLGEEHEGGVW